MDEKNLAQKDSATSSSAGRSFPESSLVKHSLAESSFPGSTLASNSFNTRSFKKSFDKKNFDSLDKKSFHKKSLQERSLAKDSFSFQLWQLNLRTSTSELHKLQRSPQTTELQGASFRSGKAFLPGGVPCTAPSRGGVLRGKLFPSPWDTDKLESGVMLGSSPSLSCKRKLAMKLSNFRKNVHFLFCIFHEENMKMEKEKFKTSPEK